MCSCVGLKKVYVHLPDNLGLGWGGGGVGGLGKKRGRWGVGGVGGRGGGQA